MTKKVLHVITGLNDGGAEAVLYRLCIHSEAIQYHVVSLMDKGKYGPLLQDANVTVTCLNMPQGNITAKGLWTLWRILRKERPDVVQTWMYHADLIGGLLTKAAGIKNIFWGVRHSNLEKGKEKKSTLFIAKLCAYLSSFIPKKIICCAENALLAHRKLGYSQKKLIVIPNGYDFSIFKKNSLFRQSIRSEFSISGDTFLIGKIGRYHPSKDHKNLLKALSLLESNNIKFKCLLVGKGLSNENIELKKLITNFNLNDHIILAEQRADIPAIMNALDLHILASSTEGFPNVLAEAMACGTRAVSTDVGDARQIIGNPQFICPPNNPEALSKLVLLMHNEWIKFPEVWIEHQNSCVTQIKENYSIERMVSAYKNCWFED